MNKNFELIRNEEYWQTIIDSINDTLFVEDSDTGKILFVNRRVLDTYGYSVDEIYSLTIGELLHGEPPYSHEDAIKLFRKAKEEGHQTVEWLAKRKGGSLFWAEITVNFVKICSLSLFVITVRDINLRKQFEIELQRVADEWRKTFDSSPEAIWILDKNNRVVRVNKTVETLLGLKQQDILGKNCWDLMHDGVPPADCPMLRAIRSLKHEKMEIEFRGRFFEVSVDPILNSDGKYDGAIHRIADISEEKKAIRELREREEKFRKLIQYSQTHIYTISKEGKITFSSPSAKTQLGVFPENILGHDYKPFIHPDDLPAFEAEINKILSGAEPSATVEYRVRHNDGRFFWHRSVIAPIPDDSGNIVAVIGNALDISEQRKAEERFKMLFEQMTNAFALHEIICDENGKAVNYRFLEVNPAFEKITGLKAEKILGKTVLDIFPNIEKKWIEKYGNIAKTGIAEQFEEFFPELGKWFDVSAFCPALNQFACIFSDITEKKAYEISIRENLEELKRWQAIILNYSDRSQELKKEVNQLLIRLGEPPRYPSVLEKD